MPEERKLIADWMERVLVAHPAWPRPLIEEEARRRAEEQVSMAHSHELTDAELLRIIEQGRDRQAIRADEDALDEA